MTLQLKEKKNRYLVMLLLLSILPAICAGRALWFYASSHEPLDITVINWLDLNKRGNYPAMVKAYEYLTHTYPDRTDLYYPLGWAYYKTGNSRKGYICMEIYTQGNPYYPSWKNTYIESVRKAASHEA